MQITSSSRRERGSQTWMLCWGSTLCVHVWVCKDPEPWEEKERESSVCVGECLTPAISTLCSFRYVCVCLCVSWKQLLDLIHRDSAVQLCAWVDLQSVRHKLEIHMDTRTIKGRLRKFNEKSHWFWCLKLYIIGFSLSGPETLNN